MFSRYRSIPIIYKTITTAMILSPRPSERYAYIDFLRGLAALLVIYQHTAEVAVRSGIPNSLDTSIVHLLTQTIGFGEIGVCIFLMVSGFVVPLSLYRYPSHPIRTFVLHRICRLYPAYWMSVLLGVIFVWWRFGDSYGGRDIEWATMAMNMSMMQTFFGVENVMPHYWTLTLELVFYAACVGLYMTRKLGSNKAIIGFFIAFILIRQGMRPPVPVVSSLAWDVWSYMRYVGFMFFGLLYRKWLLEGDKTAGRYAAMLLLMTLLVFAGKGFLHPLNLPSNYLHSLFSQLLALSIFVVFTCFYRPNNRLSNFLGSISYSLYLFHPVVFYPLYLMVWPHFPVSIQVHPHVFILLSLACIVPFSWLTYRYIEQPAIKFGKHLTFPRKKWFPLFGQ